MTQIITMGTSASGPMTRRRASVPFVSMFLAGVGTVAAYPAPAESLPSVQRTTAGPRGEPAVPSGTAIGELRRLSGLTWDQLGHLFGVSRRALHFWASGKAMTPSNEEHLQRVLGLLRRIDRGSSDTNRRVLLEPTAEGTLVVDLLRQGEYGRAERLLGARGVSRPRPPTASSEVLAQRAPRPPYELVDALQDRTHATSGRLLGSKPVNTRAGR